MREVAWIDLIAKDTKSALIELNTKILPDLGIEEGDIISMNREFHHDISIDDRASIVTICLFYWRNKE